MGEFRLRSFCLGIEMARYFFDIYDNDRKAIDDVGIDLARRLDVRDAAIRCLPELAKDALPDGDQHMFEVRVRDTSGEIIFVATLELRSAWKGQGDG